MAATDVKLLRILCFVLAVAWADERVHFSEEDERRWNTPPELTPEQVVGKSAKNGVPQARLLPLIASINLNGGLNNAHSLSLGASPQGVSLSNSFSHSGSSVSQSQSSSLTAGWTGVSAAHSNAYSHNHPIHGSTSEANSHTFSLGQANSSSHGAVINGHATSGAQSTVGFTHSSSSASSSVSNGQISTVGDYAPSFQYQGHQSNRPVWTNFGPNYEYDDHRPNQPTLTVHSQQKPSLNIDLGSKGPIRLNIGTHQVERKPEIHVSQWYPGRGTHSQLTPWSQGRWSYPGSWSNGQRSGQRLWVHGQRGLRASVASPMSFSTAPSLDLSSSGTPFNANSQRPALSLGSGATSVHQEGINIDSATVSQSSSVTGASCDSIAKVNSRETAGNPKSVAKFVRFPGDGQSIPREFVRSVHLGRKLEENDKDVLSDITDTIDEVLDYL